MHKLLWYGKKAPKGEGFRGFYTANGVVVHDINAAQDIATAMKKDGWKVVWTIHSTNSIRPMSGYEQALKDWEKAVDEE